MKSIFKKILISFAIILILLVGFIIYMFTGKAPINEDVDFGVTFSQYFAEYMTDDWQEMYLAILDELGVKKIRLVAYWPMVEPEYDKYFLMILIGRLKKQKKEMLKLF